jgi:hypothetical protein
MTQFKNRQHSNIGKTRSLQISIGLEVLPSLQFGKLLIPSVSGQAKGEENAR